LKLLPVALELCPNLELVTFERLGETITNQKQVEDFRKDFLAIRKIVDEFNQKFGREALLPQLEEGKQNFKCDSVPFLDEALDIYQTRQG